MNSRQKEGYSAKRKTLFILNLFYVQGAIAAPPNRIKNQYTTLIYATIFEKIRNTKS